MQCFSFFSPCSFLFPTSRQGLELAFAGKALGALAAFGVGRSVGCQVPIDATDFRVFFPVRTARLFPSWKKPKAVKTSASVPPR